MRPDLTASLMLAQRHLVVALEDAQYLANSLRNSGSALTEAAEQTQAQVRRAMELVADLFARCETCGDTWLKDEMAFVDDKVQCQACYDAKSNLHPVFEDILSGFQRRVG